jgi:hypothetical protein
VFASTRLTSAALAGALVCTLAVTSSPAPSVADDHGGASDGSLTRAQKRALADRGTVMRRPGQTSDGVRGRIAPRIPVGRRGKAQVRNDVSYEIAPGVTVREWDQVDARGPIRAQLLSVSLDAPNVSFDYLSPKYVAKRKTVSQLGAAAGALGAVNGDFFDISDTGAPLGVGLSRERGLLNGPKTGWIPENASFFIDGTGPHVGPMATKSKLKQHPKWSISNLNSPTVATNGLGLYTSDWGWTKGYSVTDGKKFAREVVIVNGRVKSNRTVLTKGQRIRGQVLIGRGSAAKTLKRLKVGQRATFVSKVKPGAQMAITGDRALLLHGVRTVINDRLMHPRTAVGIDADGRKLLILVIDGRSAVSRGYTMVELANMMLALGAEDALNLDGGGSSAMYTRRIDGTMGVINEPSDGHERQVANSLGLMYDGTLPPVGPPVTPTPAPAPAPAPAPTTPAP